MTKHRSAVIDEAVKNYCQNRKKNISVRSAALTLQRDMSVCRYRLEKLVKQGFLIKVFNGSGTDGAIYEVAELEPAFASLGDFQATMAAIAPATHGKVNLEGL